MQKLTMRERMEEHRANPTCAVCHRMMDPLGFALENFDGLGGWRESVGPGSGPIDASGALPDGTKFIGPAGLREVLVKKRDLFVETFTERLLTYALGRGLEEYDQRCSPQDRARRCRGQSEMVINHSWHRQEHTISNEEG